MVMNNQSMLNSRLFIYLFIYLYTYIPINITTSSLTWVRFPMV